MVNRRLERGQFPWQPRTAPMRTDVLFWAGLPVPLWEKLLQKLGLSAEPLRINSAGCCVGRAVETEREGWFGREQLIGARFPESESRLCAWGAVTQSDRTPFEQWSPRAIWRVQSGYHSPPRPGAPDDLGIRAALERGPAHLHQSVLKVLNEPEFVSSPGAGPLYREQRCCLAALFLLPSQTIAREPQTEPQAVPEWMDWACLLPFYALDTRLQAWMCLKTQGRNLSGSGFDGFLSGIPTLVPCSMRFAEWTMDTRGMDEDGDSVPLARLLSTRFNTALSRRHPSSTRPQVALTEWFAEKLFEEWVA